MKKIIFSILLIAGFSWTAKAQTVSPLKSVQMEVQQILAVLSDPQLATDTGRAVKKAKLRTISEQVFDFEKLSKYVLGRNWKRLTPGQQKEFIQLFKKLLEKIYMDRLLTYKNQKVIFTKENMIGSSKAEVFSHIQTSDKQIPIDYKMSKRGTTWKAYDIIIEGVSMVRNYRSQFQDILINHKPEEMLAILRQKTAGDN